jgi:predicted transcriptional regulator
MGYRGKVDAQEKAREMRARNMTLQDIATELGVSKSSVSL